MSETCETVTIETKNGQVIINKSDYDESIHWLVYDAKDEIEKEEKEDEENKPESDEAEENIVTIEVDGDTFDEESISNLAKEVSKPKRKYTRRNKN